MPSSLKALQMFRMQPRSEFSRIDEVFPMVPGTGEELELRDWISKVRASPNHYHPDKRLGGQAEYYSIPQQ